MTLKGDAKFEEKLTCGLEHDKEYRKFSPEQFKVSKFEEKLTCGLENDKEYRTFSPEQFKVSKLG